MYQFLLHLFSSVNKIVFYEVHIYLIFEKFRIFLTCRLHLEDFVLSKVILEKFFEKNRYFSRFKKCYTFFNLGDMLYFPNCSNNTVLTFAIILLKFLLSKKLRKYTFFSIANKGRKKSRYVNYFLKLVQSVCWF